MNEARWKKTKLCLFLLTLGGCGGSATDPAGEGEAQAAWPSWLAGLPRQSVEAAAGEPVWAVVPERGSAAAEIATYRLEAASGSLAVLIDALGNRYQDVPGALVHPASGFQEAELAAGTAVLADRWDAHKVVGRIAALEGGRVQVAYDWNGVTTTSAMDSVMLLPAGEESLALRWVAYRPADGTTWYKGLCFAENDDRAWISDDSGHVEVVAKDAVALLGDLGDGGLSVGDAVSAYSWGHGYRPGVITAVPEPGLRYSVELQGGEIRAYFFEDLTTAL